jgi:hypothetical protein
MTTKIIYYTPAMKIPEQISCITSKKFFQQTFTSLVLIITLHSQQAFAQVVESFSDGEFTTNPTWSGNSDKFLVVANQLKLQAPAVGSNAYLSTKSEAVNNASWEFLVRLNFNPSGTNYTRVYLMADQSNLGGDLNGYFVLIGDTPDEVSLYKQTGATKTKIINGADGRVNLTTVIVKIKVTRDGSGNWNLYSDVGPTGNYTNEGSVQDATILSSGYMGVYCFYTATRSDKFLFDDFVIAGEPFQDDVPPQWQSVTVKSSQSLELTFDESLDGSSSENILNYNVSDGIGHPSSAELHVDERTITLNFPQHFPNGQTLSISCLDVRDTDGNTMVSGSKQFLFFDPVPAQSKDIIISEIFADPQPVVGLPEAEFIEIYNRANAPFDLENWKISDGSSVGVLPKWIIQPMEYVVLTASSNTGLFNPGAKVLAVPNFPTLNNGGDAIILKDAAGIMIDSLSYTDTWYHDDDKKQGGYSLELIDLQSICAEHSNWISSEDATGGTPGKQNSVNANKPDATGPRLTAAIPKSETELILEFDEKLEKELPIVGSFLITPAISIGGISFVDHTLTKLKLDLSGSILSDQSYNITVVNLFDCAGNVIQEQFNMAVFGLPAEADSADVVINEVLFNPRPTGVDFVEIYNRSSKYINLKNWSIANIENEVVSNQKIMTDHDLLIAPGTYLAVTTDGNILKGEYVSGKDENFLEAPGLPAMSDDEGTVIILGDQGNIIDWFDYNDKMHSVFIKDEEGVSLERINFNEATSLSSNWKSASSVAGFATPGYINSNMKQIGSANDAVVVDPEIFQPASGQPDFTQIHYHFAKGGFIANVKIYDHMGRLIKELANNAVLGTQGSFRWDGDEDNGTKARVGYYMVWFEVFDDHGSVQTFKKRIAVAGRF